MLTYFVLKKHFFNDFHWENNILNNNISVVTENSLNTFQTFEKINEHVNEE